MAIVEQNLLSPLLLYYVLLLKLIFQVFLIKNLVSSQKILALLLLYFHSWENTIHKKTRKSKPLLQNNHKPKNNL